MDNSQLLEKLKADTIVICGSAPSLSRFSCGMLRNPGKTTCIALNNAFLYKTVKFDAMVSVDYTAIRKNEKDIIDNHDIIKLLGIVRGSNDCVIPLRLIESVNAVSFDVADSTDNKLALDRTDFCEDIIGEPLRFTKSVAVTAIQIALWLRPKNIYLVGLDFSNEGHFNDNEADGEFLQNHQQYVAQHWTNDSVRKLWTEIKWFAHKNYPETSIFSVNPVTLHDIFEDVYMDGTVPQVTGYIPVKENSVRLPRKNTLPFADSNLLINKINQLKKTLNIERIIVSTDSEEMLRMAHEENVEGIKRPSELANESRPYREFVKYLTDILPGEHIMRCPVTAPLCDARVLNDSISKYFCALENGYDSLTSVLPFQHHMLDENGPMNYTMDINHKGSQNLPLWHEIANCMDIEPMEVMKKYLFQFGPNFYRYEVDKITATDIDDKMDYEIACAIYEHMKRMEEI